MNINYKITFHTYWHCGSGLASGADADLLVIKDKDGLPYVPGKTIKGLVREAVDLIHSNKKSTDDYKSVFGTSGAEDKEICSRSDSFFKDATLSDTERKFIVHKENVRHLYQTISSTAITDEGVADDKTLRKIEVCIPCELEGEILDVPTDMADVIVDGMKYIKRLGTWRHRGLGRCTFGQVTKHESPEEEEKKVSPIGTTLKFKCELLTDVILNQKSASEGANTTLDFIPGSNFLGIVAASVYRDSSLSDDIKRKLFHTKLVRYGDAHPANGSNRTLRIPACLYFAKGEEEKGRTHYVHHLIKDASSEELREIQLKQERYGYADFMPLREGKNAIRLKVKTDFAIKSAYDRELRRSMDEQMFGYQSMGKGMTYYFTVDIDTSLAEYAETIRKALVGTRRVGRSRCAQYGLVDIQACDFNEPESSQQIVKAGEYLTIYADSRLIFLDKDGQSTFLPSFNQPVENTGIDKEGTEIDGKILWGKSQIRTFQYAPYNYQRRCFDTDRCGIEKGSVIIVEIYKDIDISKLNTHIGSYQNEGFGKVIYNPDFLKADKNGKLVFKIEPKEYKADVIVDDPKTPLTTIIATIEERRKEEADIYKAVNEWVNNEGRLKVYAKKAFASQWGNIRNLAIQSRTSADLIEKLFITRDANGKELPEHQKGYLVHGVAKDKWKDKTQTLRDFVSSHSPKTVVNLASEMQKKCKK